MLLRCPGSGRGRILGFVRFQGIVVAVLALEYVTIDWREHFVQETVHGFANQIAQEGGKPILKTTISLGTATAGGGFPLYGNNFAQVMNEADSIVARLLTLHPRRIDLSLDRMWRVLAALGHPELRLPPVIHVAGTNGKGSTVAYLDAVLRAYGVRTGRFTSPHLRRYNERICVDGVEAGDAALIESFDRIDAARGDITLTFFEYNALAALDHFRRERVETAVLEATWLLSASEYRFRQPHGRLALGPVVAGAADALSARVAAEVGATLLRS